MAVIINDLEVVLESAETQAAEPKPASPQPPATPPLTPGDLDGILRHQADRAARVRAH